MIRITYLASTPRTEEPETIVAYGLALDEALRDSISSLLVTPLHPRMGESLYLTMPDLPIHLTADGAVSTHRVSKRTVRRALERLWPPEGNDPPDVAVDAAYILLDQKRARIYTTPIGTLVAARD